MTPLILDGDVLNASAVFAFGRAVLAEGTDDDLAELRELRDAAAAAGSHPVLIAWPCGLWALLIVELMPSAVNTTRQRLIERLTRRPLLIRQLYARAKKGKPLAWLKLALIKEELIDG